MRAASGSRGASWPRSGRASLVTTADLEARRQLTDDAACGRPSYRVGSKIYPAYLCASVNEVVSTTRRAAAGAGRFSLDYGCHVGAGAALPPGPGDPAVRPPDAGHPRSPGLRQRGGQARPPRLGRGQGGPAPRQARLRRVRQPSATARRRLHEPQVPNFAHPDSRRDRLRPGMTICIEPMVTAGSYEVNEGADGWTIVTRDGSLAAHYEHTVVILSDGVEVLSLPDEL